MPSIQLELVALKNESPGLASGETAQTSICVRGLCSEEDIKVFHEVISRSAIRQLYSGLRLSYDRILVTRTGRVIDEHFDDLSSASMGETLCGTRLVMRRVPNDGGREWRSTIGGVIQIGGNFYAMTSAHPPDPDDEEEAASRAASLVDGSSPSTLVEADYDDDVEPALIFDYPTPTKSVPRGKDLADPPRDFLPTLNTGWPTLEHADDDWRLIRLTPGQCR